MDFSLQAVHQISEKKSCGLDMELFNLASRPYILNLIVKMKEGHFENEKLNCIVSKMTLVLRPHPSLVFCLWTIYQNLP